MVSTLSAPYQHQDPRISLRLFEQFDSELYSRWGEAMQRAIEPDEFDRRSRAVVRVALDSVVHWSLEVLEQHTHEAFEAGSNVAELLEAAIHVGSLEGGTHGIHDALEALEMVIRAREKDGLPAPRRGKGLTPQDMIPEAAWPEPAVFPYHSPKPRYHVQVIEKYDPELFAAWSAWNEARFKSRKELTRLMQEMLVTAVDVAIFWPAPLLDHHMHAAFEVGATTQSLLEVIVFAATSVEGARSTNIAGRAIDGVDSIHHGITALERVLEQRNGAGLLAPNDRTSPKVGRVALTV
jgi:alkylhydroperoxidase/carboxymuconolactone decarboxylase family protein YurZ